MSGGIETAVFKLTQDVIIPSFTDGGVVILTGSVRINKPVVLSISGALNISSGGFIYTAFMLEYKVGNAAWQSEFSNYTSRSDLPIQLDNASQQIVEFGALGTAATYLGGVLLDIDSISASTLDTDCRIPKPCL